MLNYVNGELYTDLRSPCCNLLSRQTIGNVTSADVAGMTGNRLSYLTADDWVLIQAKAVRRIFKLGDAIIRQGAWGDSLCIIRRGEASVEPAGTGSRSILAWLGPEDVCGEMAFLEQGKTTAAVIAKDEGIEVDVINGHDLREILKLSPDLRPASIGRWPWCWFSG